MNKKVVKGKLKTAIGSAVILGMGAVGGFAGSKLTEKDFGTVQVRNDCGEVQMVERVVDGDTLLMKNGERVRLIGIDAPDRGECYFKEASTAVKKLVEGKEVRLEKDVSGVDRFGRLLRHVMIPDKDGKQDDLNLSNYLVEQGFVEAVNSPPDLRYRRMMVSLQQNAVRENVGIWKECEHKTVTSDQWQENSQPPSKDCVIKGNISRHGAGMIYMTPDCDNYKTTKIDPNQGEKYFCSEKEAEEAGFRKAENCD